MQLWDVEEYMLVNNCQPCEPGFAYNSGSNTEWLGVEELRRLIRDHVDSSFGLNNHKCFVILITAFVY